MEKAIIVKRCGKLWIKCPMCGKFQFPLTDGAVIKGQEFKCKASWCKASFEVNTDTGEPNRSGETV